MRVHSECREPLLQCVVSMHAPPRLGRKQDSTVFGQLALRRLLSAPEHASGCPKPRLAIGRAFLTGATSEDLTLSVSIVVLFTLLFQFVQPYLALAVGMSHLTLSLTLALGLNPN